MHTRDSGSGLDAALASYQPTSLPAATSARLGDDAVALVGRRDHDEFSVRKVLSQLAAFLADRSHARPEPTRADLLTREQVAGHLQRA